MAEHLVRLFTFNHVVRTDGRQIVTLRCKNASLQLDQIVRLQQFVAGRKFALQRSFKHTFAHFLLQIGNGVPQLFRNSLTTQRIDVKVVGVGRGKYQKSYDGNITFCFLLEIN